MSTHANRGAVTLAQMRAEKGLRHILATEGPQAVRRITIDTVNIKCPTMCALAQAREQDYHNASKGLSYQKKIELGFDISMQAADPVRFEHLDVAWRTVLRIHRERELAGTD